MKVREVLAKHYPNKVDTKLPGGCSGCPWNYKIKVKSLCKTEEREGKTIDQICRLCWDQEASEKTKKYSNTKKDQLSLFGRR